MTNFAPRAFALPVCLLAATLAAAACGGSSSSPTSPATTAVTTPTVTPTRIIDVSGNLAFGTVNIGQTSTRTFTISNSGNSTLTFTGLTAVGGTGTAGYTASPTSGSVTAGGSQQVSITFTPTAEKFYSNVLTVTADQTSGNNAINVSGTGYNPNPIYTKTGTGDNVFDIPSYVTRVKITGDYSGNSSNFIVYIAGKLVVNELVGRGWGQTHFEGTYLIAGGGVAQVQLSSGVSWTVTEVR